MKNPKAEVRNPKSGVAASRQSTAIFDPANQRRLPKRRYGRETARSVLECGGPPPLLTGDGQAQAPPSARGLAQSKTWRAWMVCCCFLLFAFCFRASAQYSIDWSTIDGGGGTSTGGVYSVSGTIGQHDAGGPMTGGNYSLTGGFWSLIAVVQTPGLPNLTITFVGPNSVVVSWPNTGSYTLQQTGNLSPANWTSFGGTVNSNSTTMSVTITSPTGNLFFRLRNP